MSLEQDFLVAEKHNEEGNLLYRNKRFDEACSQYSDAIILLEMHAQQTEAAHQPLCKYLSNRAAAHLASGYDTEAVKDCTSALTLDPMHDKALLRRSLGLESLGRHSESLVDVKALLKRAQWGSPIATKAMEVKRRLQRALQQEKNSEEQPVPTHLFSKEQILRLNFRTLPPSEISKGRFFEVSVYIANEFGLFSHREFSESCESENQACVQASMIGDDPEVKLEVRNERQLVLDTRGRATFDLRFVGNDNMQARSKATLCIRLNRGGDVMGRTVLTLMSLPISVVAESGSITPFSTGLAGCMSGRGIDMPHQENSIVILENPDSGIPGKIWDGGLILSEYLSSNPSEVGGKSCLELGAGTGIVGVCCYCLGASRVMITDLEEHVELISANIEANAPLLSSMSAQGPKRNPKKDVQVAPLRWGENLQDFCRTTAADFDVILGSDIVYEPHCFAPLVETLRCLAGVGKKALIAHRPRHSEEFRFWDDVKKDFDVRVIDFQSRRYPHVTDISIYVLTRLA